MTAHPSFDRRVYISGRIGARALVVALALTLLVQPGAASSAPTPSRAGRIAFVTCCWDLWVMAGDGTGLRRLAKGNLNHSLAEPTWSPDGSQVAYVSSRAGLRRVRADGSGDTSVVPWPLVSQPAWSPAGDRIAFVTGLPGIGFEVFTPGVTAIFTVRPDGSGLVPVPSPSGQAQCPAWSPDGKALAFVAARAHDVYASSLGDVYVAPVGPGGAVGAPTRVSPSGVSAFGCPAWSPDGARLAFSGLARAHPAEANLWVVDRDASNAHSFPGHSYYPPAWSPDGRWLVYADTSSWAGVWVLRPDGTGRRRLLGHPQGVEFSNPAWSPDGSRIASYSRQLGRLFITSVNAGPTRKIGPTSLMKRVTGPTPWSR